MYFNHLFDVLISDEHTDQIIQTFIWYTDIIVHLYKLPQMLYGLIIHLFKLPISASLSDGRFN
mgnify:CR=1 FL=1